MEESERGQPSWPPGTRELADEVRQLVEALSTCGLDPDALGAATDLVRQARERVAGPRRARWYEDFRVAAPFSPDSQRAYLEQSPIRGHLNPVAPPLEVEVVEREDGSRGVRGRARLGVRYEGPPHGVHGGWVAALFDEVLGSAQGLDGRPGVTAILTVRFRHVTPIEEDLRFEGWIAERRGRRLVARATCHAGDTLTADAEGVFVEVDFGEVQRRMQRRRTRQD